MIPDRTLVELLRRQAADRNDRLVFTYVDGAIESRRMTYEQLERRARAIGAALIEAGARQKRALLLYAPDLEYVCGFLGCMFAGVTAVPAYPPDPARLDRSLPRLRAIAADADCALVLTTTEIQSLAEFMLPQAPELAGLRWMATDAIDDAAAGAWSEPEISSETVAFIQYTSGSTGDPKGVVLSHGNLINNLALIVGAFGISADSVGFSWLPPYHDMGLIGGILGPIACGGHSAIMSPIAFLQRPMRWLEGISQFRASISGGPNFAYELCLRRATPEDLERLDLSSWKLAFSGAEQVRAETIDRFSAMFAPCGFRREAFYPCYGLAEATLIVSGGDRDAAPIIAEIDARMLEAGRAAPAQGERKQTLVGCGRPLGGQHVRIVDPQSLSPCADGVVGEIWISGPSVARAYWQRPDISAKALRAPLSAQPGASFLRTGDLGYIAGGELFVTGRLKDVIIVRGRNLYPQDLEKTAEEAHPSLRRGCCAAFALELEGDEEVVIAVELERRYHDRRKPRSKPPRGDRRSTDRRSDRPDSPDELFSLGAPLAAPSNMEDVCEEVRRAIARIHDVRPQLVLLVRAGALPKTSSGKIQRSETRKLFLQGKLEVLSQSEAPVHSVRRPAVYTDAPAPSSDDLSHSPREARALRLARFFRELVAAGLGLDVESVPLDAPLTTLGLDSLTSVEIAHSVERQLGTVLPASAFMREHTIADLARATAERIGTVPPPAMPHSGVSRAEAPLSAGQEALWFLQRLAPDSSAYNLSCALQIRGGTARDALRRAVLDVARRHELLRTIYPAGREGTPRLHVEPPESLRIDEIDASAWSADELHARVDQAANEPFDLSTGPVLRLHHYVRPGDSVLLLTTHHIAVDFWAMTQLLGEIRRELERLATGAKPSGLPVVPYRTFVDWQRQQLARTGERLWKHWREQLEGPLPRVDLPTDRPRPRHQSFRGATHRFQIDSDLLAAVRSFARHHGTTPFVVLLSAFQLLLHQRSNAADVIVGIPAAGRTRAEMSRIVGLLINVVLIRTRVEARFTFAELVHQVRRLVLDAIDHQELPFSELVGRLQPTRDPARSPLIDVMFAFEQAQGSEDETLAQLALGLPGANAAWPGFEVEAFPIARAGAPFDLTLTITAAGDGLSGWLTYCSDLFDPETVAGLADAYAALLKLVLQEPLRSLGELDWVRPEEHVLLASWNDTAAEYPSWSCIHELIEEQARRSPCATAVQGSDGALSYAELDAWANGLAMRLAELGVSADEPVGVCLPRRASMLAAQLGVLKAGAAFLPLDPEYPRERLGFMVEDSGARVVVTTRAPGLQLFSDGSVHLVDIADTRSPPVRTHWKPPRVHSDQLAYLIYTSGSTGVPKGVAVPHRAVVNFLDSMRRDPGLSASDILAAVTTTSFDISNLELFLPLLGGARIELLEGDQIRDGRALQRLLRDRGITVMQATPGVWHLLLESGGPPPGLRILCGGEAFPRALADALLRKSASVHNLYGPTETTIWSTMERVRPGEHAVFLGRPIANTRIHILDPGARLTPVGAAGELYIGGEGVVRGYWNRPDLTAERFLPDPYSSEPGARMYRTGDIGRWRIDGRLEFFGRGDAQVKVRGYRVELGEVEAALAAEPRVTEAAVVARPGQDGVIELIAYVTSTTHPTSEELQRHLAQRLPAYMVPARFEVIGTMPRTPNGKIDRRSLLAQTPELPSAEPLAPTTDMQRTVCKIFEEVLGKRRIGVRHDFFAAGGHSLMATQVAARLGNELGVEVPLRLLFEARTPELLAARLEELQTASPSSRSGGALFRPIPRAPRRRLSSFAGDTGPEAAAGNKPGGKG